MKDNFSKQAMYTQEYRPTYPQELFDFILNHIKNNRLPGIVVQETASQLKNLQNILKKFLHGYKSETN
jgi:hypothetical protein